MKKPSGSSSPEIAVIGTINRDTIRRADGSTVTSWGGLLYNLKYMNDHSSAIIFPVVNAGADCHAEILKILKRFPNIDSSLVQKVKARNNHCFLHYANQSHKCEFLQGGVPPLTFARVKPVTNADLILVNFISGKDISLAALERLRAEYSGTIYMDIHSLTLGRRQVKGGVHRVLRRPRYFSRYAACADILQINKAEFEILSGQELTDRNLLLFFASLKHLRCLIITLGAAGSAVVYKDQAPVLALVPPVPVARVHDTTGCGDIFAAGFIIEYLQSKNFIRAAQNGNRLASSRCRIRGKMF
jgi:hypothetical protein